MAKLVFLILFLTLFLVSTTTTTSLALPRRHAERDPEKRLQECLGECSPFQLESCIERCQREYEEQKGGGGEGNPANGDPEKQLLKCLEQCSPVELVECMKHCQRDYEEQKEQGHGSEGIRQSRNKQEEGKLEKGKETENNPYVFKEENFTLKFRTDEGSYRVLNRFARESDFLIGIDYYALGLFEANPNAVKLLHHSDADAIYVVIRGRGTISLLRENNKESYKLRQGDILRVTSGTTLFIASTDSNKKLFIVKLLIPTSIPGEVQEFFSGGGEDPESVYGSFSKDLIQAALKISEDQWEKITRKQNKGPVVRASREQIREIERHASNGPLPWPFGESRGPFNLLDQRPTHSNKYGKLYEASERDYGELRDPDVLVSVANIAKDAMRLPFYNTRSGTLAFVAKGKGYFEMVCPHLSRQRQRQGQEERSRGQGEEGQEEGSRGQGQEKGEEEGSRGQGQGGQEKEEEEGSHGQGQGGQEKEEAEGSRGQGQGGKEKGEEEGSRGQGQEKGEEEGSRGQGQGEEREARIRYEKVRASLSPNTVHYVPPAHPFITVASSDEGLQIIYFELFAHGNRRNYLAGRNNFLRSMGKEEAELSYNTSAKEMQDIVHAQDDIGFSKGPQQGRGGGSHTALESIVDFMVF